MAPYQKLLIVISSTLLASCAVKFDPVEHSRLVEIRYTTHQAISHKHCADAALAKNSAERINNDAIWLQFYAEHIPNNKSLQIMAAELHKTTDDFARRYSQPTAPSRVFCELKLKNILTQIETIQHTNARRPR